MLLSPYGDSRWRGPGGPGRGSGVQEQQEPGAGPGQDRAAARRAGAPPAPSHRNSHEPCRDHRHPTGPIHLRLFEDKAPLTVANFVNLAQRG
ncbi:MAG: peptidylprolyl isomerase, partial [Streptosporangiaceae bacterium]